MKRILKFLKSIIKLQSFIDGEVTPMVLRQGDHNNNEDDIAKTAGKTYL